MSLMLGGANSTRHSHLCPAGKPIGHGGAWGPQKQGLAIRQKRRWPMPCHQHLRGGDAPWTMSGSVSWRG